MNWQRWVSWLRDCQNPSFQFKVEKDAAMTDISDLQAHVPSLDFKRILKSQYIPKWKDEVWEIMKKKIKVSRQSLFFNETYNVETIIQTTPKRVLANYLSIHFLHSIFLQTKGKPFRDCVNVGGIKKNINWFVVKIIPESCWGTATCLSSSLCTQPFRQGESPTGIWYGWGYPTEFCRDHPRIHVA